VTVREDCAAICGSILVNPVLQQYSLLRIGGCIEREGALPRVFADAREAIGDRMIDGPAR